MNKHEEGLRKVFNRPDQLGLEGLVIIGKEVRFYRDGQLVAEPDIFAISGNKYCILGEYKSHHTNSNRKKAIEQLHRAEEYLSQFHECGFRYSIDRKLYLPGDYHSEDIS